MVEPIAKSETDAPLYAMYSRKSYDRMSSNQLLMLHRALTHKILLTRPDLIGPEYDERLKELSDEMLLRVTSAGVELVP